MLKPGNSNDRTRFFMTFMTGLFFSVLFFCAFAQSAEDNEGVYVRFKLSEPKSVRYYVRIGGYIHIPNWYIPAAIIPAGADTDPSKRLESGSFTGWFDLKKHAGSSLHGRLQRSGGIAEFPNITAEFITDGKDQFRSVVIELATSPDEKTVVKKFEESFNGTLTSFLVSPDLRKDADSLETASQMTQRRLSWAHEASGSRRVSPENLIIQTSFWAPQRKELNLKEAEVLWLLGFNVVGNQMPEVKEKFGFKTPGHLWAEFGPSVTQEQAEQQMKKVAVGYAGSSVEPGTPFNYSDEVTAPAIGNNPVALSFFREWLKKKKIRPEILGVKNLEDVVPIESPEELFRRQKSNKSAANRTFYYTSRFRQESTTQKFKWLTEAFHKHVSKTALTSTLVADHPYFAGTGLGMGMGPNPAWGSTPLAADWFDMARQKAVDMAGIEDWMGLQYMYGPNWTWEGFQLMGFQAAIFRSGSRGTMPVMAWITPSDETNLRLKSASALCQGAKHFFYWTYGPTATSTENYWSDLKSAYSGIVHISNQLARAETILAQGTMRPTKVALLYSISSDLWQPFGYAGMLERRLIYFALVHSHYLVDMLTEEDVIGGRLKNYDVLYTADPCISEEAMKKISDWVSAGGYIFGTCAAGSRNEFNEEVTGLCRVFGIKPGVKTAAQPGPYHIRGALNEIPYTDTVLVRANAKEKSIPAIAFGVIGEKSSFVPSTATIIGTFSDGSPAVALNRFGRGKAIYVGACPGISYGKDAKFVRAELKEKWPSTHRDFIVSFARAKNVPILTDISHPVVEAGIYDSPAGTALVLANFTYEPIEQMKVRISVPQKPLRVVSCENGAIAFDIKKNHDISKNTVFPFLVEFSLNLGLNDIVLLETE